MTGTIPRHPIIAAIPMEYRGVTYRSTLEADWAATMDALGWFYNYEPIALTFGGIGYLPDFFVPNQNVWLEVKGPHDERIHKAERLATELDDDDLDIRKPLVVILRASGPNGMAIWEGAHPGTEIVISTCPECRAETFVDLNGIWVCRQCWTGQRLADKSRRWISNYHTSGRIPFQRAPRPARAS